MAHSARSLPSVKGPPSSRPRDQESRQGRTQRDKDNHWERRHEADHPHRGSESYRSDRGDHKERKPHPSNGRSSTQSPPYSQHSKPPTVRSEPCLKSPFSSTHMYGSPSRSMRPEKQSFSEKCSNLCSRRGLLKLVELVLNILVLICAASTESASAGFTGVGGLGSTYYYNTGYAMSGFQGDEIAQLTELDAEFGNTKRPTVYCAVVLSFLFSVLTFILLAFSCMSKFQLRKLLIAEAVLAVLFAGLYIIGIALYVHFIQLINATDVCTRREALYRRRGYNSVSCSLMGTEVAVCVFSVLAMAAYIASAITSGLALKEMSSAAQMRSRGPPSIFKPDLDVEVVPMKTAISEHV
ncbi:MARVEL domain-containing protein 3-like isoform X3 [Ambystoma mexicanum]|uniref:MARVEL domain-containing protein 3-like isoform X3 n=1 Tax=Ambystoma mexicanum TaxID=8296 RepID=UPI0037E839B7